MAAEIGDNEPVPKLTTKLRSEIMPPEPFEYTVLNPTKPIVEPENKEEGTTEWNQQKPSLSLKIKKDSKKQWRVWTFQRSKSANHKHKRQASQKELEKVSSNSEDASISKLHTD